MFAFDGCRFTQGKSAAVPGYIEVTDFIQDKKYLGRLLPRVDPVGENLEFWSGLRHPGFLFIPRFWTVDGQYMVLLEHLDDAECLQNLKAQRLTVDEVGGVFLRMLNAFAFLQEHHLALPRLDLTRLYYHRRNGLKITGHEIACRVEGAFLEPEMVHFDMRYCPPEWLSEASADERSGVYYAAALLYHFLSGRIHQAGKPFEPVTATFRRLKKGWNELLASMLAPDAGDRPTFGDACSVSLDLVGQSTRSKLKREMLAFLPVEDSKTTGTLTRTLLSSEVGATTILLETCPGVELVRRISALIAFARCRDYLVLQTWHATKSGLPFKTINDIIRQLVDGVFEDLGLEGLAAEFLPLSEFDDSDALRRKWTGLLSALMQELKNHGVKGVLLVVEDVQNLDHASLTALTHAAELLKSHPVMFAFTCDTLTSPECALLRDRWPLDHTIVQCEPDGGVALSRCVWTPSNKTGLRRQVRESLAAAGGNEILFLKRMHPLYPLRGKEYRAFLRRIWENLTDKEQLVMKLLVSSFRALSWRDMQRAFGIKHLNGPIMRLIDFSMIRQDPEKGDRLTIRNEAIGRFCHRLMGRDEKRYVRRQLLDFEMERDPSDAVQVIFLALKTNQIELAKTQIDAQVKMLSSTWERATVAALAEVFELTDVDALRPLSQWATLLRDIPVSTREAKLPAVYRNWSTALRKNARGDFRGAVDDFLKLSRLRSNSPAYRAFFLLKSAICAFAWEDRLTVANRWRSFNRLDLSEVSEPVRQEWISRFTAMLLASGSERLIETADWADLPESLHAWIAAHQTYLQSDFRQCVRWLESALPAISKADDVNWAGDAFKMYGNALYKSNRVDKAIDAYRKSRAFYSQAKNQIGLDNLNFNLATSEKLAGRLLSAVHSFAPVLKKAEERSDQLTQCQVFYNLSVIAMMQFDVDRYRDISERHLKLARRIRDISEIIRGLSLALHNALIAPKAEVVELIAELELQLKKGDIDRLLRDEADVALRLGYFVVGKAFVWQDDGDTRYTSWRHRFIDFLQGDESQSLEKLTAELGTGLFRCYHLLWIKTAVEAGLIPQWQLQQNAADAFSDLGRHAGARVRTFLKQHMSHLKTMGDVPRPSWERAIQCLESLAWWDADPQALTDHLIDEMRRIWRFDDHGFSVKRGDQWRSIDGFGGSHDHLDDVNAGLGTLDAKLVEGPVITTLWRVHGFGAAHFLALPFRFQPKKRAVFWALREATEEDLPPVFLEPLYRFYAKLLEYAVGLNSRVEGRQVEEPNPVYSDDTQTWGIIGKSGSIEQVLDQIRLCGPTDLNIFIWGESGTGKELVARALHQASSRADQPFRAINCSHFPESLIESQLFGYRQGAFTGATTDRSGVLELAHGGTLFLDEIGDLHPKIQSLLLRVIQNGEFSRVGEARVRRVDLRFVTATNKDIHALIDQGVFRRDLFFRIAEEQLHLPPLRNRTEDFFLLASHFAHKHMPRRSVFFRRSFFDCLRDYSWPGNVREFESYIRRVLSRFSSTESFDEQHVLPFLMGSAQPQDQSEKTLEDLERGYRIRVIKRRLEKFGGNRTQTAKSLGISRQRLTLLIKRFHLD